MKTRILLTLTGMFVYILTFGQDYQKYAKLIDKAWKLYESKEYVKSGQKYSQAFMVLGNKGMMDDFYNAACSWALANQPDSAFVRLYKIASSGYFSDYDYLMTDKDLISLHQDPGWKEIAELVKSNKEKAEANLDKTLVAILDTIFITDQEYRNQISAAGEKFGWGSNELQETEKVLAKNIKETDSINLLKIEEIIGKYGWLGVDVVGEMGNTTLWLVIQHSDLPVQEKYLPLMREAVKNGKAFAYHLAYLEDRVALRQGKRQIYGSQIGSDPNPKRCNIAPLEDPDNVDKRRAEVGLPPLAEYASEYQIKWNVKKYKKDLPKIEAMEKAKQK